MTTKSRRQTRTRRFTGTDPSWNNDIAAVRRRFKQMTKAAHYAAHEMRRMSRRYYDLLTYLHARHNAQEPNR